MAGTEIRMACLHAPRHDDGKTVVMEVRPHTALSMIQTSSFCASPHSLNIASTTSPKDWGMHRDGVFKKMVWTWEDENGAKWDMRFGVTEEPLEDHWHEGRQR